MNKKISAVLISALMVLTMFTAMVPTASAAETVTPPYEFIGVADKLTENGSIPLNLFANSSLNPSIMYYDIDDQEGNETLSVQVEQNLTILKNKLVYESYPWFDENKDKFVSYLGNKYYVVDTGSDWILSQVLVEEKSDDDHLLRVGETLTLAEGFSITALEIDVDGKKAWISVSKDGEELKNLVIKEQNLPLEKGQFNYTEDLGAADDTTVISFTVETVFAGMNTNLVKINTVNLISMATETLEGGTDTINDYRVTLTSGSIKIVNDEDISLSEDDVTDVMDGRFGIRVSEPLENQYNENSWTVGIVKVLTKPGTYELFGVVGNLDSNSSVSETELLFANSSVNPSIMYYDIDDQKGNESLTVPVHANLTISDGTLIYESYPWLDENNDKFVSYLGNKYYVVDTGSDWILSQVLVEEKSDDDHLLRVGETLTLAEGFSITALEIDVDGKKAWISVSKDGEELKNLVVKEQNLPLEKGEFNYTEDLGAADDTTVISFTVETVFAGMNTNLVKINTVNLISMATETLEGGTDTINDYRVTLTSDKIKIVNDEDISLSEDDITDVMDGRFAIRVSEALEDAQGDDTYTIAIVKEITIVGDGTPTATKTATPTPTVTQVGTEPGDGTEPGTATPTATATEVVPTPTPTKEPGFEAVFAVAGLLAVAYLVLRQRD
ncbi:MAG: S-layer protein domain-containing protein [Methanosarcinales archaeon]|nr:S-layer protein domain-containing protein [Methanosarcinales archaeon]